MISALRVLERGDLRREIVGQVLVAAGVEQFVAELVERRREAHLFVAPGVAVAVVREQRADYLIRVQLAPHVGEDADHVFEPPEVVIDVIEGLPCGRPTRWVCLLADEPGLPRRERGDARDFLDLALGANGIGGLRRISDQHQVDLVLHDEVFRDLRRTVRIRLTVLENDFDRARRVADLDPALGRLLELTEHELVCGRERRERSGRRADVADLDRFRLRDGRRVHRPGGERRARGGGVLEQRAAIRAAAISVTRRHCISSRGSRSQHRMGGHF